MLAGILNLGRLTQEADREVVVDLNGLIRVWSMGVVGNGLLCLIEVEVVECHFHEGDAPFHESIHSVSMIPESNNVERLYHPSRSPKVFFISLTPP